MKGFIRLFAVTLGLGLFSGGFVMASGTGEPAGVASGPVALLSLRRDSHCHRVLAPSGRPPARIAPALEPAPVAPEDGGALR